MYIDSLACFSIWLLSQVSIGHVITIVAILMATAGWIITVCSNRVLSRRQHTVNVLLEHSNSNQFREHVYTLYTSYPGNNPITDSDVKELLDSRKDAGGEYFYNFEYGSTPSKKAVYVSIRAVLNYYEFLAICIKNGDLDSNIMQDFFRSIFCNYAEKTSSFILTCQQQNPKEYENIVALYKKWKSSGSFPASNASE